MMKRREDFYGLIEKVMDIRDGCTFGISCDMCPYKDNEKCTEDFTRDFNEFMESIQLHQEIIRCKDCIHWTPGVITETDDFIPPRCLDNHGVGWHANDFCSYGEKKE